MFSQSFLATYSCFYWIWVTCPSSHLLRRLSLPYRFAHPRYGSPLSQSTNSIRIWWTFRAQEESHRAAQKRQWLATKYQTSQPWSPFTAAAMGPFSLATLLMCLPAAMFSQASSSLLDPSLTHLLLFTSSRPTQSFSSWTAWGPCLRSSFLLLF